MLEAMGSAALHLLQPGPLIAILLAIPLALIVGVMIGGVPVFVLLLSIGIHFDPFVALPAAIAFAAANDATEPIPSIMLGIPGSRGSQATILDGYPLARQGRAGYALGATYISSMIGGLVGAAALLLSIPVARELLRLLGSAEFFLLTAFGVLTVALLSAGAFIKGMLTAAFGLCIGLIGFSPIGGEVRATFGIGYIWEGLPLVPVLLGLFAVPELANLVVSNTRIAADNLDEVLKGSQAQVKEGMREALRHKFLVIRSSLIGMFVGMLPGLGAEPAHWIAYATARQTEKGATKTFGTGDIRGVMAAESSNNAIDGGVLIPTLFFSIPGSSSMAIILAFLILQGIQPGPPMLNEHLDLTIALVYCIAGANLIVVPIVLRYAHLIARVSTVPPNVLAPLVLGLVVIAVFQTSSALGDLVVFAVAGLLGLFMKAYGWPRPPIIIALVLAEPLEKYLHLSLSTYGWSMLSRPQFLILLFIIVGIVSFGFIAQKRAQAIGDAFEASLAEQEAQGGQRT